MNDDDAPASLPSRRLQVTYAMAHAARDFICSIGFDRAGKAREIFVDGLLSGSELENLTRDACILASKLLQSGSDAEAVLAMLMRADVRTAAQRFADENTGAVRPSLLAALVMGAVRAELENGAAIREAYLCADRAHPLQRGRAP